MPSITPIVADNCPVAALRTATGVYLDGLTFSDVWLIEWAFADCSDLLEQAFSYLSLDLDFKLIEGLGPRTANYILFPVSLRLLSR